MLQAAQEMLPPSPACLGGEAHAGRRQKSLRASQLHRSPLAKERRPSGSWEQQVAGKGEEPGAMFAQSSLSSFLLSRVCD